MGDHSVKVKENEQKLGRSQYRGISSSCDDLLEEKVCSDSNEPIGLITQEETQFPSRKENDNLSPNKGKKSRRRKISMPWFRQSSFGLGLQKLRLPKQHTIASSNSNSIHPDGEGPSCRAVSSSELLHQKSCELVTTTTWVIADHVNSPGCPGDIT